MSAQFSTVHGDRIEYSFWLTFDRQGGVKLSRGEPDVTRGQRAMKMSATLPMSLFKTPTLVGSITVIGDPNEPLSIDVKAASEAIKMAIGCDVDLRVGS